MISALGVVGNQVATSELREILSACSAAVSQIASKGMRDTAPILPVWPGCFPQTHLVAVTTPFQIIMEVGVFQDYHPFE